VVYLQVYKKADIDDSYIPATEKSPKTKNKGKKKSYSSENIAPSINVSHGQVMLYWLLL